MPSFVVEGADAANGEDRTLQIEAATEAAASDQARGLGVLASAVRPIESTAPPRPSPAVATSQAPRFLLLLICGWGLIGLGGIGLAVTAAYVMSALRSFIDRSGGPIVWFAMVCAATVLLTLGAIALGVRRISRDVARRQQT